MQAHLPSLDTIFCAAVDIASATERDAYVAHACGDDLALRAQVEKLVAAHFRAGSFLESPNPQLHGTLDEPMPSAQAGSMIGPYKLLEQIGEGGFGVVYMLGYEHDEDGVMQETLSAGERLTMHGIDVNDTAWLLGLPDLTKKREPFAWWM